MQYYMSRYGGHGMTFGAGKSSDALLPEDQSVDYLLDNYANEIIPNYFFISSYDAKPNWMGGYEWKLFQLKPVKLGTLHHNFNEILLQHEHEVVSDIFITPYLYSNVYGVFIKTHKRELKDIIPDYEVNFDYVLLVFIREQELVLKKNPRDLERILTILFYKMDLVYEGYIKSFTPSKTFLGKQISSEFCNQITSSLIDVDSDEKLVGVLKNI